MRNSEQIDAFVHFDSWDCWMHPNKKWFSHSPVKQDSVGINKHFPVYPPWSLFFAPSTELKPPPPQSRRNTLSCLKGAEPSMLLSASTPDSISIVPSSEAASQLSSPAAGPSRSDASGCHGRRGMMQAIKNERRASKVRIKSGAQI